MSGGFPPEVWGPSMWFMFHVVALTYPQRPTREDRQHFSSFYTGLKNVLPCEGCRKGYTSMLESGPTKLTPETFASRDALFKWTVDVHNRVNAKLRKPVRSDWKFWFREYDKLRQ